MNVTLSPELEKIINQQLVAGTYKNAEEVIAAALHLMQKVDSTEELEAAQHDLETKLIDGVRSKSKPVTPQFWENLKTQVRQDIELNA